MIAGPLVIDASVVVEFLIAFRHTARATRLFAAVADDPDLELWAPDLVYPEVVSALRKLVGRRLLGGSAAARAIAQLARLPISAVGTAPLVADLWSLRGSLTPYDACYVALARRLDAPFVTADERLARALRRKPGRTLSLGDLEV